MRALLLVLGGEDERDALVQLEPHWLSPALLPRWRVECQRRRMDQHRQLAVTVFFDNLLTPLLVWAVPPSRKAEGPSRREFARRKQAGSTDTAKGIYDVQSTESETGLASRSYSLNVQAWRDLGVSDTILEWIEFGFPLPLFELPQPASLRNYASRLDQLEA